MSWTSTPRSSTYCPEFARRCRCSTGSTATRRACDPRRAGRRSGTCVTHTAGLGYWFWNADLMRYEQVTGRRTCCPAPNVVFTAPLLADPGTRFEYGINTDWLGQVVEAVAGTTLDVVVKEGITGPLGHGRDDVPPRRRSAGRTASRARPRRGRDLGLRARSSSTSRPTTGRAGTACTPRRATTSGSSGCCCAAVSWTASGSCTQETVDAAFTNQIGDLDFPAEIPTADPPDHRVVQRRARAGSGATACC